MIYEQRPIRRYVEVANLLTQLREAELYAMVEEEGTAAGLAVAEQIIAAYAAGQIDGTRP